MYPAPWSALPGFAAHDWMPYSGEQSLEAVAASMCEAYGIRDGDSVVGSSLGGMVGCEIARLRKLKGLYLVGSAVGPAEVSHLLARLHPLIRWIPLDGLRRCAAVVPSDLTRMFAGNDSRFMRAMCRAIFTWGGGHGVPGPVHRLHGRHDRVIPLPSAVDLELRGGHLISISHAAECAAYVRARET